MGHTHASHAYRAESGQQYAVMRLVIRPHVQHVQDPGRGAQPATQAYELQYFIPLVLWPFNGTNYLTATPTQNFRSFSPIFGCKEHQSHWAPVSPYRQL